MTATRKRGDGAAKDGDEGEKARIDAYLAEQTPAARKTINHLRKTIKDAVPELVEKKRWSQIGYLIENKDVCGIYAASDHVNVSFMQGAALRDPEKLLEGTGKGMRHIKVYALEELDERAVRDYVKEAASSMKRLSEK
jgi:hypothetical protein